MVLLLAGPCSARAQAPVTMGFGMALTGGLAPNGRAALFAMQIWEKEIKVWFKIGDFRVTRTRWNVRVVKPDLGLAVYRVRKAGRPPPIRLVGVEARRDPTASASAGGFRRSTIPAGCVRFAPRVGCA